MLQRIFNRLFGKQKKEELYKCKCEVTPLPKLTPELKSKLWEEMNTYRNNWSEGATNELTFVKLGDSDIQWLELNKKHPSYIEHNNETYFLHGGWSQLFPMVGKMVQVTYLDNDGDRIFFEIKCDEKPWDKTWIKNPIYWKYSA